MLVEAIEQEFVPLLVYNNEPGPDAELLGRYHEPAWNNPVVRFFAADGRELLPRADGVYAAGEIAERLAHALAGAQRALPGYLALAVEETSSAELARAVFAMPCFWHGEAVFGALPGVRSTRVGYLEGREVVEVGFDPVRITWRDLVRRASAEHCAERVWVEGAERLRQARELAGDAARDWSDRPRPAGASDQAYQLAHSACAYLPLTPLQATRINGLLGAGGDPRALLTPAQRALLARIERAGGARPLPRPTPPSAGSAVGIEQFWRQRAELERALAPGD